MKLHSFSRKEILEQITNVSLFHFLKWCAMAVVVGIFAGGVGTLFHHLLGIVESTRNTYAWLIYLLPVGGVIIAALYHFIGKDQDAGTNLILKAIQTDEKIPAVTAPLIVIATLITHLFGGSAGREGAALQLGGSLAEICITPFQKLFHLTVSDKHVIIMCGMSATFCALFCTPVTAVIFALEVATIGAMYYAALVPCTIASLIGYLISTFFGAKPFFYYVSSINVNIIAILQVIALAALTAFVSIVFLFVMRRTKSYLKKYIKNSYLRAFTGGLAIVVLTLLVGSTRYNGAGMDVITSAMEGNAFGYDFILKIIFTAITLGAGFKGGEIVPSFFIGATFGCFAGSLIGLDPTLSAALGLLGVFCGVTNCPLASIVLGVELFGSQGLLYYCMVCAVSYMLSGYSGLYNAQGMLYSKYSASKFDRKAHKKRKDKLKRKIKPKSNAV